MRMTRLTSGEVCRILMWANWIKRGKIWPKQMNWSRDKMKLLWSGWTKSRINKPNRNSNKCKSISQKWIQWLNNSLINTLNNTRVPRVRLLNPASADCPLSKAINRSFARSKASLSSKLSRNHPLPQQSLKLCSGAISTWLRRFCSCRSISTSASSPS